MTVHPGQVVITIIMTRGGGTGRTKKKKIVSSLAMSAASKTRSHGRRIRSKNLINKNPMMMRSGPLSGKAGGAHRGRTVPPILGIPTAQIVHGNPPTTARDQMVRLAAGIQTTAPTTPGTAAITTDGTAATPGQEGGDAGTTSTTTGRVAGVVGGTGATADGGGAGAGGAAVEAAAAAACAGGTLCASAHSESRTWAATRRSCSACTPTRPS